MMWIKTTIALLILGNGFLIQAQEDDVDWNMPLNYEGIFILGDSDKEVLQQCARESVEAKLVWRPTYEQVKFIDIRLRKHLKAIKSNFKVLPKQEIHRQYIGYTDEKGESVYINVYPVLKDSRINETRTPIVSCDKSRLFWGISFSIETFKFSDIQYNDRLIVPIREPDLD